MARVDAHANDPLGVPQAATSKQDLIWIDWNERAIVQLKVALKFVQVCIGALTVHLCPIKVLQRVFFSFSQGFDGLGSLFTLQIGLTVEIFGFNV